MKLVVVGDVLLDADYEGSAGRLSPDAPVPVVDVDAVRRRAGGAGLVARMLASDGIDVELVTVLSDDESAPALSDALDGISVVSGPSGAPTPVKTRIRAGGQAVVRFDQGGGEAPVPTVTDGMLEAIRGADAVVVADYGRGLTRNEDLRLVLERIAAEIPVVWDPHPAGAAPVPGVAAVTPNISEALRAVGKDDDRPGVASATAAAEVLLRQWNVQSVIVTMGEQGALLYTANSLPQLVPAPAVSAGDPCGAGDRFSSGLAHTLMLGEGLHTAATAAVQQCASFLAAGGVAALGAVQPTNATRESGSAPEYGTAAEPSAGLGTGLAATQEPAELTGPGMQAFRTAEHVRENGGTVVATGGCFDLLHAGHARTLSAARKLGDCLIVCLNSDDSVTRLKGPQRPIMEEQDRVELLLSLECVDAVLVFDEDTPEAALNMLRPDIWAKGGDYDHLPEAALLQTWGGTTVTLPFYPARSTTHLAAALQAVG